MYPCFTSVERGTVSLGYNNTYTYILGKMLPYTRTTLVDGRIADRHTDKQTSIQIDRLTLILI